MEREAVTGTWPFHFHVKERTARRGLDDLAGRAASGGEPFRTFYDPSSLLESMRAMGCGQIEDLGPGESNDRYFRERADGLRVGSLAHVVHVRV